MKETNIWDWNYNVHDVNEDDDETGIVELKHKDRSFTTEWINWE